MNCYHSLVDSKLQWLNKGTYDLYMKLWLLQYPWVHMNKIWPLGNVPALMTNSKDIVVTPWVHFPSSWVPSGLGPASCSAGTHIFGPPMPHHVSLHLSLLKFAFPGKAADVPYSTQLLYKEGLAVH